MEGSHHFFLGGGLRSSFGHWVAMKLQDVKSVKHQPKHSNKPTIMPQNSIRFLYAVILVFRSPTGRKKRSTLFLKPSHCRRIRQIIRSRKQQENGREAILIINCNYCITFILDLIPLTKKRRSSYNYSNPHVLLNLLAFLTKNEVLLSPFNQPKKNI